MVKNGRTLKCKKCGRTITFQNNRMEVVEAGQNDVDHILHNGMIDFGTEIKQGNE